MSPSNPIAEAAEGAEHRSSGLSEDILDGMTPSEELAYELARSDAELVYGLKEARIAQGFTEHQFAAALGVSVASLRAFEGGQSALTLAGIRRYAHGLGVVIEHRIEHFEPGRSTRSEDADSTTVEEDGQELSAAAEALRAARELQDERLTAALTAVRDYTVDHGEEFRPLSTRILATLEEDLETEEADDETVSEEPQEESPLREDVPPRDPAAVLLELQELLVDYSKTPSAIYHSYHMDRLREMLAQLTIQG